jgi:hypothetical protein
LTKLGHLPFKVIRCGILTLEGKRC